MLHTSAGRSALVVDDEPAIRALVARVLEEEGWSVSQAGTGPEALASAREHRPDLVILDVMLPAQTGLDVLSQLRSEGDPAVILLTALGSESDRIRGLDLGADDYITKPFSPGELAARVRSVTRRTGTTKTATLEFGDLCIDRTTREVTLAGTTVGLTAKEFDLLAFLADSPRQVFSREQLLANVWSSSSEWQDAGTVTEHVRRIRKKIEANPDDPMWIRTVRGVGYRFEP
jgi:DNA-binding response OmpR family regulator